MDEGQMHDIGVLSTAIRDQVQEYLASGLTTTPEGARAALSLVLSEVQGTIRSAAELALTQELPDVDIAVEEPRPRYMGPV